MNAVPNVYRGRHTGAPLIVTASSARRILPAGGALSANLTETPAPLELL